MQNFNLHRRESHHDDDDDDDLKLIKLNAWLICFSIFFKMKLI